MSGKATPESTPEAVQALTEADTGWVPLAEASKASGMSVSGLRKLYREGRIDSRLGPGPTGERRFVNLEAVLAYTGRRPMPGRSGPVPDALSLVPVSTFNALQVAYLETQRQALDAEVRARVAEHDLTRTRYDLTRTREDLDRLRAELDAAKARRRWWRSG